MAIPGYGFYLIMFFAIYKRKIFFALRLFVSIGVLIYLLNVIDGKRTLEFLSRVSITYLWPAPLLVALALCFGGVRWSILLPYFGIRLKATKAFLYYLIGSFYGIALPGVIGGDAVRIGICAAGKKKSVADITATVLIERMCGILALLAMGTVAIAVLTPGLRSALGSSVIVVIPVLAGASAVAVFAGYLLFGRVFAAWVKGSSAHRRGIAETIRRIIRYAREVPPAGMAAVFFLSALFQFSDILASFFLARAINIDVSLLILLAIFPIVYMLTVLPVSLGGLGVREGALAYLLTRVGVLPSDAVMLSFMIYLNRALVSLLGGALQVIWKPAANPREAGVRAQREERGIPL